MPLLLLEFKFVSFTKNMKVLHSKYFEMSTSGWIFSFCSTTSVKLKQPKIFLIQI